MRQAPHPQLKNCVFCWGLESFWLCQVTQRNQKSPHPSCSCSLGGGGERSRLSSRTPCHLSRMHGVGVGKGDCSLIYIQPASLLAGQRKEQRGSSAPFLHDLCLLFNQVSPFSEKKRERERNHPHAGQETHYWTMQPPTEQIFPFCPTLIKETVVA